jgi:hypothetical protein
MYPYPDYQNYLNQMQIQQQQLNQQLQNMQQMQRTVLDRVQGEASADVYPVQPGQEVILFDIDNPFVYRKSRGMDNKLEQQRYRLVLDEKETETEPETVDLSGYVREDEIAQIVADAVEKKLSEYTLKPTKAKKQAEEE